MQGTAQKTTTCVHQTAPEQSNHAHFLGQIPEGTSQTVLSFLTRSDTDKLGPVNQTMLRFLHADGLSTAAFLDQLEQRQQRGISMTYAEHQRCRKLIQEESWKQYELRGRNGFHTELPIAKRLTSIIQHIDCNNGNIGDYELREIVEAYPNLKSLDLTRHSPIKITDIGLSFIGKLPHLQSLNLGYQIGLTNVGFAHISRLPLKSLSLEGCDLQDENVRVLGQDENSRSFTKLASTLTHLYLCSNWNLTHEGLSQILGPCLTSLHLEQCTINDATAALLATLPLKELNLFESSITEQGLALLKNLSSLTYLGLGGCDELHEAGLANFFNSATCPLECLDLSNSAVAGSIMALQRFPNLTHLNLYNTCLTNDQAALLGELRLLTHLNLFGNPDIMPSTIQSLGHLPLKYLNLGTCNKLLNDDGMNSLIFFSQLEELVLNYSHEITGNGLAALAILPLRRLHLRCCDFSDEDIQTMAEKLSLQFLDLRAGPGNTHRRRTDKAAQALSLLPLEHLVLYTMTFPEAEQRFLKKIISYVEVNNAGVLKRPLVSPFTRPFQINH
jgi:hypothetical protein